MKCSQWSCLRSSSCWEQRALRGWASRPCCWSCWPSQEQWPTVSSTSFLSGWAIFKSTRCCKPLHGALWYLQLCYCKHCRTALCVDLDTAVHLLFHVLSHMWWMFPQCLGRGSLPHAADSCHWLPHSALWRKNQQRYNCHTHSTTTHDQKKASLIRPVLIFGPWSIDKYWNKCY